MYKRIALLATGLALAFGATPLIPSAHATKGVCQPDAVPGYQDQTLSKGNQAITVDVHYGWDGVSVYPVCVGPLISAHVTNVSSNQTWYAVFPRPKRPKANPIVITMGPGFDQTYTAAQLSFVGLDTNTDLEGLDLTQTNPLG